MKTKLLSILLIISISLISCEKENYTAENYIPKKGHDIEKVEKYWGKPDSRNVSSISGTSYITYFYDSKRSIVYFINFKVDSYSFY